MEEDTEQVDERIIIEIDKEFLDILNALETKIKKVTWEGMEKVSKKTLTRILARKIKSAKLL